MSERTHARRVLVTGLSAVGKSTVCRLVAEGLSRSTVIDADVVRESIVGGFVQGDPSFPAAFVEQVRLQREIVNFWIDRMVDAGYHAVVDDAPMPPPPYFGRDYAKLLADPMSIQVLLTASKEALRSRLAARNGPFDDFLQGILDDAFPALEASIEDGLWDGWTIIDTTDRPPSETAALILERF